MRVIHFFMVGLFSLPAFAQDIVTIPESRLRSEPVAFQQTKFAFTFENIYKVGIYAASGELRQDAAETHALKVANKICQDEGYSRSYYFKIIRPHARKPLFDGAAAQAYYVVLDEDGLFDVKLVDLPTKQVFNNPLKSWEWYFDGLRLDVFETHAVPAYEFFELQCVN